MEIANELLKTVVTENEDDLVRVKQALLDLEFHPSTPPLHSQKRLLAKIQGLVEAARSARRVL